MIWAVIWYWLFTVFTVADIITTKVGLAFGFYEGNILMRPFLDHMIETKIFVLLFAILVTFVFEKYYKDHGWLPLALGTTFTALVVIQNIVRISGII